MKMKTIKTTGDLRRHLEHIAVAVAHGDMKVQEAWEAVAEADAILMGLWAIPVESGSAP